MCNTLEYAHSQGILHRDIKPGNIMLGPYGETLLVDWGLAKPIGSAGPDKADGPKRDAWFPTSHDGTQAGMLVGTPAYMSPEQALGWREASLRPPTFTAWARHFTRS